uniref:Uncharacterized protein n=1 Tax=Tetradesmus obliquus TaxID=3088 RepID=A0A383VXR0_TETOB|eukprot:jgi/Sobl393_1/6039/SZX69633.1
MSPACLSFRAAAAPASIHAGARRRPAAAAASNRALLPAAAPLLLSAPAFFLAPRRKTVLMRSSDSGEKNDDQLVSESGEVLQGKQKMKTSLMSDDKQAQSTKQGGASEGDRATAGQAAQPTGEQQGDVAAPEAGDEKGAGTEGQTGQAPGGPQEVSAGWELPSSDTNPAMDPAESRKYSERETQGSTQVPSSGSGERETQGDADASNKGMAGAVGGAGGYGGGASEFGEGMDQMRAQGSGSGSAEPRMKSGQSSGSSSGGAAGREGSVEGSVDGLPEGKLAAGGDDAQAAMKNVGRAESAGAATSDSTAERVAQVYGVGAEAGAGVEEAEVYQKEAGQEKAGDEGASKAFESA